MRIHLYSRKYEKALGIQCFLLYTEFLGVRRGVYEFKLKMDDIHDTRYFYFINFICSLWSLFIFHLSEMVTEQRKNKIIAVLNRVKHKPMMAKIFSQLGYKRDDR